MDIPTQPPLVNPFIGSDAAKQQEVVRAARKFALDRGLEIESITVIQPPKPREILRGSAAQTKLAEERAAHQEKLNDAQAPQFQRGTVVYLKSGSLPMVIERPTLENHFVCRWYDHSRGAFEEKILSADVLCTKLEPRLDEFFFPTNMTATGQAMLCAEHQHRQDDHIAAATSMPLQPQGGKTERRHIEVEGAPPIYTKYDLGDILRIPNYPTCGGTRVWEVTGVFLGALHQESTYELRPLELKENMPIQVPCILLETHTCVERL